MWADVEMGGNTSFYFAMPTFDEREREIEGERERGCDGVCLCV